MATVNVRGAEIAYERSGTGPDMIWGHGLSQTRASDLDSGWMDYSRLPVTLVRYDAPFFMFANGSMQILGTAPI